jgi:peptidoglycan-associated lipoprotein
MSPIALRIVAPAVLLGASVLVGCAHEHVSETVVPAPLLSTTRTTSNVVRAQPTSGINVSDGILTACKIDFNNVGTAPKFDFDRSDLSTQERTLLESVAKCVTAGPLKGRSLQLVGRADPRGEVEYNFLLGGSRAWSVDSYLMSLGLDRSRIETTSRGKLDATGTDEAGWRVDRRVDIALR